MMNKKIIFIALILALLFIPLIVTAESGTLGTSGTIQGFVILDTEAGKYMNDNAATINTTVANTLTVTVELSSAGANYVKLKNAWTQTLD